MSPYRTSTQPDPLPRVRLTGDVLLVSDDNASECARALQVILANMKTILDWTSRYPVFVEFAGYRFCLEGREPFEQLVAAIECKMAEHLGRR